MPGERVDLLCADASQDVWFVVRVEPKPQTCELPGFAHKVQARCPAGHYFLSAFESCRYQRKLLIKRSLYRDRRLTILENPANLVFTVGVGRAA